MSARDALGQAALERLPLGGRDHARDRVDEELGVAVDRGELTRAARSSPRTASRAAAGPRAATASSAARASGRSTPSGSRASSKMPVRGRRAWLRLPAGPHR